MFILILLVIAIIIYIAMGIKFIPQQQVFVVERLGKYNRTLEAGIRIVYPIVERVRSKHDLRLLQINIHPQDVITNDNVGVTMDTLAFYKILDPHAATYSIESLSNGIYSICQSAMRQSIGKLKLDDALDGREKIAADIRSILDEATHSWGIRIERVEIIDITPPEDIRQSMNLQMTAERQKRASVLDAEGQKQSQILKAEGQKQAQILKAQGDKEARILEAEGLKQSQELEAQGQAEAIRLVAQAERTRLEEIQASGLSQELLAYRSFEAMEKTAQGESNTIFIPSSAADALASAGALGKIFQPNNK